MSRVAVIGNGGWGTALAMLLRSSGQDVAVWGHDAGEIAAIREAGSNDLYLPGVEVGPDILWTEQPDRALAGAELAVMAIPSQFVRTTMTRLAPHVPPGIPLVSVTKGFDPATDRRMSEVLAECLPEHVVCALSGPSHAEEVARGVPTAVVLACADHDVAQRLQPAFMTDRFRVYSSSDVTGVELGGALKNVMALAVGVSDGLGFGDNTRAALIARGLAEMLRLGCAMGAVRDTFSGLSGLGDLVVTCCSRHSRNRGVGERIGRGESVQAILAGMKQVAEGVSNAAIACRLAERHGVDVPIAQTVNAVLHHGMEPARAVRELMLREARPEVD